ncbi:MAG: quinone oxidoreductase [Cyclobacteriaceae bacterium]|nr:quinone oxidoreductase [Cyclobacteriaceae bacterium]
MITYASVVHQPGPATSFAYEEMELAPPGPQEVLVKHHAIGVNFIDTYFRSGLYPWTGPLPIIPGAEASGEVMEAGSSVSHLQAGDRIAYTVPNGAYCQHRVIAADRVVKLPDDIPYETAAAIMVKGLTAQYLLRSTFNVQSGHTILIHAAAGGVGLLAGQWAAHLGATVIGTAGSADKAQLALQHGYHHVINYREQDFVQEVQKITSGQGVEVVYDSVGQDTYPYSLQCLKRRGMWVCFGQSSGVIEDFDLRHLVQHGSLFATRPTLFDYIPTYDTLHAASEQLFDMLLKGHLKVQVGQKASLKEVANVHQQLEGRKTVGSSILTT